MKNIKFLSVLLVLGLLFVSCEKQSQEKEWNKYYGYPNEEIVGTYAFSNIKDAFDGLTENAYCHICEDARINITASSGSTIEFNVNCPSNEFNRTFEGRPCLTDDDCLIQMIAPSGSPHSDYKLMVYVYKNDKGDIRLHGYARLVKYEYNPETEEYDIPKLGTNYWFDVIKN
jgi:hypothetical protein